MSAVERLTAALAEREAMIDAACAGEWKAQHSEQDPSLVTIRSREGVVTRRLWEFDPPDADLIVAAVNQQRALIAHARDVLARHHRTYSEQCTCCDSCAVCGWVDRPDDCPEIASLLAAWCPA